MMKISFLKSLARRFFLTFFAISVFIPVTVYGDGSYTFNIQAYLTASSCTVGAENLTFNFYINDVDLQEPGSGSEWVAQPGQVIKLYNCFGGTHSVDATISGAMDDDDKDGFKNQIGPDYATGLSVQLKSGDTVLHDRDVITKDIDANHRADIPLAARLYTVNGNVKPGEVYTVINLTLTYK